MALGFAGKRPSSQEQPDQSTERELFKEQCRYHGKQHCAKTVHCFEKQTHYWHPPQSPLRSRP